MGRVVQATSPLGGLPLPVTTRANNIAANHGRIQRLVQDPAVVTSAYAYDQDNRQL